MSGSPELLDLGVKTIQTAISNPIVNPADGFTYSVAVDGDHSSSPPVTRLQFLKMMALGGSAGLLAACTDTKPAAGPAVSNFATDLENKIGYSTLKTDDDLRNFIYDTSYRNRQWMTNASLGTITTRNQPFELKTSTSGELEGIKYAVTFQYKEVPETDANYPEELNFDDNVTVYIYGQQSTKDVIKAASDTVLAPFVKDYFSKIAPAKGKHKALHLNFLPIKTTLHPKGIEKYQFQFPSIPTGVTSQVWGNTTSDVLEKEDIVINLHKLHLLSDLKGIDVKKWMVEVFANENINRIAIDSKNKYIPFASEAASTVFGWLAAEDPKVAERILGAHHQPVMDLFEKELIRLKLEGQRPFNLVPARKDFAQPWRIFERIVWAQGPHHAHLTQNFLSRLVS